LKESLDRQLFQEVEGTCSGRYGYIVSVVSVDSRGCGEIEDTYGSAKFRIRYKAIVFKPFRNEVINVIVTSVNKMGFYCEAGPLSLFVSSHVQTTMFYNLVNSR
jgi:DNA-directed RNA polymerase II subunit RPB7